MASDLHNMEATSNHRRPSSQHATGGLLIAGWSTNNTKIKVYMKKIKCDYWLVYFLNMLVGK